ncbi:hypothetical protein KKC63_00935 [Patescibacteria group bacterium]|nr:hypothetical protein [Patescibacteria group bacterium]MBU4023366.1 hypothetical protein [Patescibacteria group bacterium]MBU4078538.1 hypothetical protein [Patescibacteria group bacterium]
MKKGLKFAKKQLEDLYWNKGLSLREIGEKFHCNDTNILYWLKKFKIKRRPAYRKKIEIPKNILKDLYWNKNLSSREIAKMFGIKHGRTILKKLNKFEIPTKTVSQALTKKLKNPFSGRLEEKAYFLGLRAGDFYARWIRKSIRIQTSTTHLAQINLLKNAFRNYGETCIYLAKSKSREDEWFIYVDLHPSFEFLVTKPNKIPDWILKDKKYFFQFLTAYMDCEGSWKVQKSHQKHIRFMFKIKTGDLKILKQIKKKLEMLNYHAYLYLEKEKGTKSSYGSYNQDIFDLSINRKEEIVSLINKLLPLSKHSEKTRKMNFILKYKNKKWNSVEEPWNKLREEIKSELLKNQV